MIRVLLVEDHTIVRDGLRALLAQEDDIDVVAEAGDGRAAIGLAVEHRPEVVVMDVALPELNGADATRRVVAEVQETKVLALSMHSDRRYVAEMLLAGASGYLLKDCAYEELARAIRAVVAGERYLGTGVAGVLIEDYLNQLSDLRAPSRLSTREREVVQLLAEGKSTRQTAGALGVSVKTVETHRANVMRKLDVHSMAELTKFAIREGLTSLEL